VCPIKPSHLSLSSFVAFNFAFVWSKSRLGRQAAPSPVLGRVFSLAHPLKLSLFRLPSPKRRVRSVQSYALICTEVFDPPISQS
jgi:hypothetical protein